MSWLLTRTSLAQITVCQFKMAVFDDADATDPR